MIKPNKFNKAELREYAENFFREKHHEIWFEFRAEGAKRKVHYCQPEEAFGTFYTFSYGFPLENKMRIAEFEEKDVRFVAAYLFNKIMDRYFPYKVAK